MKTNDLLGRIRQAIYLEEDSDQLLLWQHELERLAQTAAQCRSRLEPAAVIDEPVPGQLQDRWRTEGTD